jgi:hypothetical protein
MKIEDGYIYHASMAQLHRWYIGYESPAYGIANQLDILDEDIIVKSGLGEARGHVAYAERVQKLPASWQNAHHVKSAEFMRAGDGVIKLHVNITYLNKGLLKNGVVRTAELIYAAELRPTEAALPKFARIDITQESEGTAPAFTSAYAENRLLSLVHYWLALIEDPARNPEPVLEILADGFVLNFSSGAISSFDGFKRWLAGPGSQVKASTHAISNFTHETVSDDTYKLTVDFDWEGILPNDDRLVSVTRHRWTVLDNSTQRFARIRQMDVELLRPFAPKNSP